jgi:hypothetical protein
MRRLCALVAWVSLLGCVNAGDVPIPHFYDYWQRAPDGVGPMGTPTKSYRELFVVRGPQKKFYDATDRDFYYAALSDTSALHRFLHSSKQFDAGAPSEEWVADMVVLALAYGDDRLHDALQHEPKNVREQVGAVIEQQMQQDIRRLPRTRSLYSFRKDLTNR